MTDLPDFEPDARKPVKTLLPSLNVTVARCGVGKSDLLENQPCAIPVRLERDLDFGFGAALVVFKPRKGEADQAGPFDF